MSKILIIGAGAMGTAFALPCLDKNHDVNIVGTHFMDHLHIFYPSYSHKGPARLSVCPSVLPSLRIWESENPETWESVNPEIWESENPEI